MTNIEKIIEFLQAYPGHGKTGKRKLAERLGVTIEEIDTAKAIMKDSPTISEYDKMLEEQNINPDEVTSVWYKSKGFSIQTRKAPVEFDENKFIESLQGYEAPEIDLSEEYSSGNKYAVLNLYDIHADKLGMTGNGGKQEIYDNLEELWRQFKRLALEVLEHNPHTIIFPIGNDFFNTNGPIPATRRGTPQERTAHWHDSFELGVEFYRRCIDFIRSYTVCYVINIPGNHDHDLVLTLGTVIKALYRNADNVVLQLDKSPRKYVDIGQCLLGFAHGQVEHRRIKDLPTAMAIENSNFSTAAYRVFFLGDKHHAEEYSSLTKLEHNGVEIKFLRAATSLDQWHNEQLWIGARKSISASVISDDGSTIRHLENFF